MGNSKSKAKAKPPPRPKPNPYKAQYEQERKKREALQAKANKSKEENDQLKEALKKTQELLDKKTKADAAREAASEAARNAKRDLDTLMTALDNKLISFEKRIELARGPDADESTTEVGGGRTVMRVKEIRVSTSQGMVEQMQQAIGSFIQLAQGGTPAKKAAVGGAQSLVSKGIDSVFGVSAGQSMEKQSFVILYLNYAFVRVDYFIYTYNVSAEYFGASFGTAGCCYIADLAVLRLDKLHSSEIDYLITQNIKIDKDDPTTGMHQIMGIKFMLAQSAVLARLLKDEYGTLTLEEIKESAKQYAECQKTISDYFKEMPDFVLIDADT